MVARRGEDSKIELPADAQRMAARPDMYTRPLGAALSIPAARQDEAYLRDFITTFTSVTPENAMKWEIVEPRRGDFDFDQADSVVDVAQALGKRVRGHPLVWDQQLPAWAGAEDLRRHVRALAERYRGRVAQWDVVNEPLESDGSLTRNVFERALGERYIDAAFATAHAADPDAKLFLNELAAERGRKLDALVDLVARLKGRGVPIDGVGLQDHTNLAGPPTERELAAAMRRFARLGLAVEITELDVSLRAGQSLDRQAAAFAAAARACAAAANCGGVTVWGVSDRWSWLGAARRATLFDAGGRAKPALAAVRAALEP